jgi:class 3 adenylate cyclase
MAVRSFFILLCWLFLLPFFAFSQNSIEVGKEFQPTHILDKAQILIEKDKSHTIQDIEKQATNFVAYKDDLIPSGESKFWLRLELQNTSSTNQNMIIGTSRYDFITFYAPTKENWNIQYGGLQCLHTKKSILYGASSYASFTVPSQSKTVYYLHIENKTKTGFQFLNLPLTLMSEKSFEAQKEQKRLFHYIFLGAMLVMFIYNAFLYLFIRDSGYLYYIIYVASLLYYVFAFSGDVVLVFYSTSAYQNHTILYGGIVAANGYFLFGRKILSMYKHFPVWNRLIFVAYFTLVFAFILTLLDILFLAIPICFTVAIITYTALFVLSAVSAFSQKYSPGFYFFISNNFYFLSQAISISQMLELMPLYVFGLLSYNFVEMGAILELMFASLGLADRINLLQKEITDKELEKQKMLTQEEHKRNELIAKQNEELEQKVEERTHELADTNDELAASNEELSQTVEELNATLELVEKERQKSDSLLLNILPEMVANELKDYGFARPQRFEKVTVLFTDFKGFTQIVSTMRPEQVLDNLNYCFSAFDKIIRKYHLEKIKTIGDAYMCAGGLPVADETNPERTVQAALEILQFINDWKAKKVKQGKQVWDIRIGVHTGSVVAGVVGDYKFAYDIWGDAVNIAARMESSGEAGKVNISGETYELIKEQFICTYRGKVQAKNKGDVDMYFVEQRINETIQ